MKKCKTEVKGITLIALVVTIIVLLILAGIAINLTVGNNGLFSRAENAKLESRGASVEEAKNMWKSEKEIDKYANGKSKTLVKLLEELLTENMITEKEKKEIEETGKVKIGSRIIDFGDEIEEYESYKGYSLEGVDGDLGELEIKIRFNRIRLIEYLNQKEQENIENITDEDIYMKYMKDMFNIDMTFEEYVEEGYGKGELKKIYKTVKEMALNEGMTEEKYLEFMEELREKYSVPKKIEDIDSFIIYNEEEYYIMDGITVPCKVAEYTFIVVAEGEEYEIKVNIRPNEIINKDDMGMALDVENKQFYDINSAKLQLNNKEIEVESNYIKKNEDNVNSMIIDDVFWDDKYDDFWDSDMTGYHYIYTTVKTNKGEISGYISFFDGR